MVVSSTFCCSLCTPRYYPTNSKRFSATQEIPHNSCNPKFHHRIHNSPPPVHILSQVDLVHAPPCHFSEIYFNIILPSTFGGSKWSPSLKFPHQSPACTSLLSHTCYMPCPPWSDHGTGPMSAQHTLLFRDSFPPDTTQVNGWLYQTSHIEVVARPSSFTPSSEQD